MTWIFICKICKLKNTIVAHNVLSDLEITKRAGCLKRLSITTHLIHLQNWLFLNHITNINKHLIPDFSLLYKNNVGDEKF